MKIQTLLLSGLSLILFSCKNENQSPADIPSDSLQGSGMKIQIAIPGCYTGANGKDSFSLNTDVFPEAVTGTLQYQFYEKDNNTGSIQGVMKGDTLYANYTFMSEGEKSVREVVFLIKDTEAIEGAGEMEMINDTLKFKKPTPLDFSNGIRMAKVSCTN